MFSSGDYNHCYIDNSVLSSLYSQLVAQRRMLFLLCGFCQMHSILKASACCLRGHEGCVWFVGPGSMWKALQTKHVPPFSLIKDLHTVTKSCVRVGRSCTASFPTSSGVRQGCVMAPALFRTAIDWIMSLCADKAGVSIRQSLFTDIDCADDAVLLFAEDDVQWTSIFESFDTAANTMGLHTSWAKTKIQNVASSPSLPSCVISRHRVEAVNKFTYLGSDVDSSGYCTPEILRRIVLASSIMSQLDRVWRQSSE